MNIQIYPQNIFTICILFVYFIYLEWQTLNKEEKYLLIQPLWHSCGVYGRAIKRKGLHMSGCCSLCLSLTPWECSVKVAADIILLVMMMLIIIPSCPSAVYALPTCQPAICPAPMAQTSQLRRSSPPQPLHASIRLCIFMKAYDQYWIA